MRRTSWQFFMIGFCFPALLWAATGQNAARPPVWTPGWSNGGASVYQPNSSFLNPVIAVDPRGDETLADELWNRTSAEERRKAFERKQREYEERQARGMVDRDSEQARSGSMEDVKKALWTEFRDQQIRLRGERIRRSAKEHPVLGKPVPQVVLGAAFFAYGDDPLTIVSDKELHLMARSKLQEKRANFQLQSSVLNGSVSYAGVALDNEKNWEMVRVSVYRGLPLWELSTGLEFRSTSQIMNASLSKRLSERVTAVFDTSRDLISERGLNEERVSLLYGFNF